MSKPVKIVVVTDSFKGSMSAERACDIIAETIMEYKPNAKVIVKPMADGGEGTAQAMIAAKSGKWIPETVMGPLPEMNVRAGFAWFKEEHKALVEMASASGLELLTKQQLNPMKTTTYGTGQLIRSAIKHGARKVLLAVGGSATVDGGAGAAMALGWSFLTANGKVISLGGAGLSQLSRIVEPVELDLPPIEVLCDVDSSLCGEHGAAQVYGPQKGATTAMINRLESNLEHLASLIKQYLGRDVKDLPRGGAAGGLAAGSVAFMDAHLVSGIDALIRETCAEEEIKNADWVITGEGTFDHQSLRGKVVSGIARIAQKHNTKVAVLAGQVMISESDYLRLGIITAISCKKPEMPLYYALENCRVLLRAATKEFVEHHL